MQTRTLEQLDEGDYAFRSPLLRTLGKGDTLAVCNHCTGTIFGLRVHEGRHTPVCLGCLTRHEQLVVGFEQAPDPEPAPPEPRYA